MENGQYIAVKLPQHYQWVLFTSFMLAFECMLFGFLVVGKARSRAFTKDFMMKFYGIHGLNEEGE